MIFAFIALAAAAIALCYYSLHSAHARKPVVVDVIDAIDGRTIEVMREGNRERVVLAGIGFPSGDPRSEQDCAEIVAETALGKRLYMEILKEVEGCRYALLKSANGDCLNTMMLSKGLARYEPTGIGYMGELIDAENAARHATLGVWDKNRALYRHLPSSSGLPLFERTIDEVAAVQD